MLFTSLTAYIYSKNSEIGPYNLRRRRHSCSLTQKQSNYNDCKW